MPTDVLSELYAELGKASPARLAFTRKAFQMLPGLDHPAILDVGCGQGGPTLELARLSGGQVTGLDVDPAALQELARRGGEGGLADRIHPVQGSLSDMGFPDEAFDIVWSEGTMYYITAFLIMQKAGGTLAVPPEGLNVKDREGPLNDGELERAATWAKQIRG
jgi:SAM-dependent methyltransferase